MRLKLAYKLYFILVSLLTCFTFIVGEISEEAHDLTDYLDYTFSLITLSGVFGYAFVKQIFTIKFWRIFLPVLVFWDITILKTSFQGFKELMSLEPFVSWLLIGFTALIVIPGYIILYFYCIKSDDIWFKNR